MNETQQATAKQHEEAAHQFEIAAKLHHDAARNAGSGNYEKAEQLAQSAGEAETVANRHAMQALDLYRQHAEEVTARDAERAAEEAARVAKREAKI
jgi:hypothetical protein